VVAAGVWVAVGTMAGLMLSSLPVVSLLGTTSITFVSASVLFGWVGVLAAMALRAVYLVLLDAHAGLYPWASTAAYGAAGALAWVVFRYVPRLGRAFPDGRTFIWFVVAAGAGSALSSTVISATGNGGDLWRDIALWSRSTAVSVWVFAPALIVLGRQYLGPWLAPIPAEAQPTAPRRVALVRAALPGEPPQVVDLETRELPLGRGLWLGALAVAAITGLKLLFSGETEHRDVWWNLLYMVPIWWMARGWRMTGAVLAVGLVCAAALGSDAVIARDAELSPSISLAIYARLLAFWLVGALLGRSGEREGRLLDGLADLHHRLEQDLQRVVKALTGAVEAKDAYTEGHLQRVNAYAREVGRRLGLPPRELELLQIASTLHDIGKIGIPEQVLGKPGALSPDERQVMQRHPEIGARLLSRTEGLREAATLVLHHQERWDGRRDGEFPGYPGGLAGEAIPLGARIIAVVDAFDAMTTDRPYRRAIPAGRARAVLASERGAQFDPRVVDVFLALLDERPWS
jgi:HD-GYP domain-containing protein (c-di-GMP phosphodiesterase class II)